MKKPIIGVTPLVDIQRESYWLVPGYMKGIEVSGGIPIMLPPTCNKADIDALINMCDGFLFTGGQDISPSLYREKRSSLCGEVCKERDTMEEILFEKVLENDKSALGICRGIQFFNAYLGGTIYQDLIAETKTKVFHKQKPPYGKPSHIVNLVKGSPLQNLLKTHNLSVNSYHHQGVKKLAGNLEPMAYATDNLVESVYMPSKKFVWAVQWHPEFSYTTDKYSRRIFKAFVDSCL